MDPTIFLSIFEIIAAKRKIKKTAIKSPTKRQTIAINNKKKKQYMLK
jgi:hypothetical protein